MRLKRRLVVGFQRTLLNPVVRRLAPRLRGWVVLETTGRRSGRSRRVPVGVVREEGRLWVVAEHGRSAGYVRNLEATPEVRVLDRGGWRRATARTRPDVTPRDVLRRMSPLNAVPLRLAGTDLLVVEIVPDG